MISVSEDDLICDFAETYHIYDYKRLPVTYAATLAVGLRESSRIKMKIAGSNGTFKERILTMIFDVANIIKYYHTQDAVDGVNQPELLAPKLFDKDYKPKEKADEDKYMRFSSGEDFKKAWNNGV